MKKYAMLFVAIMLLFCMASCSMNGSDDKASETTQTTIDPLSTTSYDYYRSPEDVYEINSKHCPLFFPVKWQDKVETIVNEDEGVYTVSFFAVFGTDSIPLYNFTFGSSDEGYLLGTVKTEAGDENVYLTDTSSAYKGQLSEEDELTYFEMCEGVNDIISNLVYVSGMTLAG